ncbi:alpha/beta hydrolase [Nocardia jejuensis]|uniref:alpha/beta hydrolase n=1 Tax=Nocardia jejuensis TaxID=328049 RepID=UPI0008334E7C|nr:alpha/beta hydrolase [Nocardia jejuensis]
MTLSEFDLREVGDDQPHPVITRIDGIAISGLLAQAREPRAVLVALHGGQTTSVYFDCPGHPRLSLLRTAARLGYTTLALDRPGYGAGAKHSRGMADPRRRVDLMYAATDAMLGSLPRGKGVFLLAHSAGCELAVRMAADARGAHLLGMELGGSGAEPNLGSPVPPGQTPNVRHLVWHPEDAYPPELVGGSVIGAPRPEHESIAAHLRSREEFPDLAARVRIPLHITIGEHERVWRTDEQALNAYAGMFTAAPRRILEMQRGAGHNLSLGHTATAYHLKALAFAEECVTGVAGGSGRNVTGDAGDR